MKDEEKSLKMRIADAFRGYRVTEYAILIAVIAIIVTLIITWLGFQINGLFSGINDSIPTLEDTPKIEQVEQIEEGGIKK